MRRNGSGIHLIPRVVCFVCFVNVFAQSGNDPAKLLAMQTSAAERLDYGKDPLQFGELRVPDGKGPFPLVIMIHGGCGEKQLAPDVPEAITSYRLLSAAATSLTAHGFATWNIEYRRLGDAGGGWPNTFLDVAAGTDFIRSISALKKLDLRRVVVLGHSSGGQLALWDTGRKRLPRASRLYTPHPLRILEALSLDGPADLASFWPLQQQMCGGPVLTKLMGGSPEQQPSRYAQGSITGLAPVDTLEFVIARSKPEVLFRLAQAYVTQARRDGVDVTFSVQRGASHFDAINPESEDWNAVVSELQKRLLPVQSR